MKNKILWVLTIFPFLITLFAIQFMPDSVPMHYDIYGNIDRWGIKYELFILPSIILLLTMMWKVWISSYNKKNENEMTGNKAKELKNNVNAIQIVAITMTLIFSIMQCYFLYLAYVKTINDNVNMNVEVHCLVSIAIGIMLVFCGSVIPTTTVNSIVGIRTKWSMKNNNCWRKSNQLGGRTIMIAGLIMVLHSTWTRGFVNLVVSMVIVLVMVLLVIINSYKIYKKDSENKSEKWK